MSTLYTGSAAVLNDFLRNKSPLASLVYSSQLLPDKQKKAAYALLFGTLRCQSTQKSSGAISLSFYFFSPYSFPSSFTRSPHSVP